MGHQFSKDEHHHSHQHGQRHPLARNAAKAAVGCKKSFAGSAGQDDVRSRTTETTHQSTPPASPKMMMMMMAYYATNNGSANPTAVRHHPQERWRRTIGGGGGGSSSSSAGADAASTNPSRRISSYQQPTAQGPSYPLHQQQMHWQPSQHRSSAPVKCPPKTRRGARGYSEGGGAMSHDGGEVDDDDDLENYEDSSYLERMYDLKSWDMFYRITQARKKAEEQRKARDSTTSSPSSTSSSLQRHHKEEVDQANHPPPAPQDATETGLAATMAVPVPNYSLPFSSLPPEVDEEWENLGLDYDGDNDCENNHVDASESHLIFTFDF